MAISWISSSPKQLWKTQSNPQESNAPATLTSDSSTAQKWTGFGGCFNELGWSVLQSLPEEKQNALIRDLFSKEGCGFTYCRLPIGASDFALTWYSHNENEGDFEMKKFSIDRDKRILIPYIKKALAVQPDITFFASPWCPPTWIKHPQSYNHGQIVWEEKYLKAYALYFSRFVQAYAEEGIKISAVHVQNEPHSPHRFPGCVFPGDKMHEFIRDYLGPRFEADGLDCEIWVGTLERPDYNRYANRILNDPATRKYVGGIGYQWAGRAAVKRTTSAWPDVPVIQTENECGDGTNTWDYAQYVFDLFQDYISSGVVAYVYWNMILQPGGESTWGWTQNSMITIDPDKKEATHNPEFFVMKHFSHFIQPGAVRIHLTGKHCGNAVAFRNPDKTEVYVVQNPFEYSQEFVLERGATKIACELEPMSVNTFVAGE